jgi:hypothetical protein
VFISHWDPDSSPGYYDVAVYNDCFLQSDVATYKIKAATSQSDEADDIYLHPEVSHDKYVPANEYVVR